MSRTKVFVSYCHDDRDWLKRFSMHLAILERRGLVDIWSDTRIGAGADWEREIEDALTAAKVAVLLVSPAFLASEYIWKYEMPRVVAHSAQGMSVLPLIVRPCAWRLEEDLARLQARPTDGKPLSLGTESQVDSDLSAFTYELAAQVGRSPVAVDLFDTDSTIAAEPNVVSVVGEWTGHYNQTRLVQLTIQGLEDSSIRGTMKYPEEDTVTTVRGSVHPRWSPDDQVWAQLGGANYEGQAVAVSFREIGYERKGGSAINLDGEYRAFVRGDDMTGAWFSGQRLVGSLTLRRVRKTAAPKRSRGAANLATRAGS